MLILNTYFFVIRTKKGIPKGLRGKKEEENLRHSVKKHKKS